MAPLSKRLRLLLFMAMSGCCHPVAQGPLGSAPRQMSHTSWGTTPADTLPNGYTVRSLSGFVVLLRPEALQHPLETDEALRLLERKLSEVRELLSPANFRVLTRTRFWIEWAARPDGAMEFHRSASWLQDHGYDPAKVNDIEVNNLVNFVRWVTTDQPMLVLHELAHAYQFNALGDANESVRLAWQSAADSGKYRGVARAGGRSGDAYALRSPQEYFAELTECYFGHNDYFPFTRDDLRTYDPEGYSLMERIWAVRQGAGWTDKK